MSLRTKLFRMMPWAGGVNTSLNPSVIDASELVQADNVVFADRGARGAREGINFNWDDVTATSNSIIGNYQFNYGLVNRASLQIGVTSAGIIRSYSQGGSSQSLTITTAYPASPTKASFITFNNKLIIAVDGTSNPIKTWSGTGAVTSLAASPSASILQTHIGRIWCNDKTNIDRLHYCTTGDESEWIGAGDSGALDIGKGDGDNDGITAIFPTFNGVLFVAKRTRLYKVTGWTPETFVVKLVSNGIGCISHNSVVSVDHGDIFFVSERGVHSLATSANYGDFESTFLSNKIHKTFVDKFTKSELPYTWGIYLPDIQSVLFTFRDSTYVADDMNTVWCYNIILKAWYQWPNISCQSMAVIRDTDKTRIYFGGNNERIAQAQTGSYDDVNAAGADTAINMTVKTGIIYPDGEHIIKGFKRLSLYYGPSASHSVVATITIDNFSDQSLTYSATLTGDLLGTSFVLGQSVLGGAQIMAPYTLPFDGYGRGFQLQLTQNGVNEFVELQGFGVEYEAGSTAQEV